MKIKYITIHNFRGIDKLEKLEVSSLNTFVGKNDSGKSIILRALDFFFNEKKFDNKDIFKGKPDDENTIIELSFLPSIEIDDLALDSNKLLTIRKKWILSDEKLKITSYYLSYDFIEDTYQDLWNKKEPQLNRIITALGEEAERSGRGKTNLLRIEQIKDSLNGAERKDIYHELGDFLKEIERTYGISLPVYSLFDAEEDLDIEATRFQSQFKNTITECFESVKDRTKEIKDGLETALSNEFEEIRQYMNKNVSGLRKINPKADFDWSKSWEFDLSLEFDGEDFDVPVSHKGTGFKRLLMVAYFEYRANKRDNANQIFAIEEPETYLHPSAQADLLSSIMKISENSQFFLTTHSPVFAGATDGENSILVTKDKKGISRYSKGENIINQIITELGIIPDYNLLKNTKFLIFVEGPDDVSFLKILVKNYLDKDLEKDCIACVIGGGSSLTNYAKLSLFKEICNNSNKYAVFVDGDNGDETKRKAKEKIRNRCCEDGALFCELSKREIENYCHPQKIKECYIEDIKQREGESSQNPIIYGINHAEILIDDETDVENHIKGLVGGLSKFKPNGMNIKVFESMTKEQWESVDEKSEIKNFIDKIYSRI
jgi:predicted ATP-dependent endonuclease of OLD family